MSPHLHSLAAHMSPASKRTFTNYQHGDQLHGSVSYALFTRGLITTDGAITELGLAMQHHLRKQQD